MRRNMMRNSSFRLLGIVVFIHILGGCTQQQPKVKNIIFCIGDGMGTGPITLTETVTGNKLFLTTLRETGLVRNRSANNVVTDSAAAATALATGVRTKNRTLGVDPEGKPVRNLAEVFKAEGKAIGILTTCTVTDATPAAFLVHIAERKDEAAIAVKEIEGGTADILMGGGSDFFLPEKRGDHRDLMGEARTQGYQVALTAGDLAGIQGPKILGLFNSSYLNYTLDRSLAPGAENEPTLETMTAKALEILSQDPEGFFLLVEGGRIDHSCHNLSPNSMVEEVVAFDQAVKRAHAFTREHPDTLLLVVNDHDTMGFTVGEGLDLDGIRKQRASVEWMIRSSYKADPQGNLLPEGIRHAFTEYAGIKDLTDAEVARIRDFPGKKPAEIGAVTGAVLCQRLHLWCMPPETNMMGDTHGHDALPPVIFSEGAGAEAFRGMMENVEIPARVMGVCGVVSWPPPPALRQ